MKYLRLLILIGQLGRIWAKTSRARKIYQSVTALGFFSLLTSVYKNKKSDDTDIRTEP